MIRLQQILMTRLKAVGVTNLKIGSWDDRSTWIPEPNTPAAQAILDAFDPVAAQAELEAEEAAEKTRAEKIRTLADCLRTQSRDVREKFTNIEAKLELAETVIRELRARVKALEEA